VGMTKTPIEIDDEMLAAAAQVLGTRTKKDTVNAALREISQRLVRLRALEDLGRMADRGDFDDFLDERTEHPR
jgi:Arc/MetJ family transcription regulator